MAHRFEVDGRFIEGPLKAGKGPVAYKRPSGKTVINPHPGAPGVDGRGLEYVSDQEWMYDRAEATAADAAEPGRIVWPAD